MKRDAILSPCGVYRYYLLRRWSDGPAMLFLMLNPSTADAHVDDATVRKCIGFAKLHGHGAVGVVNLFAFRARHPKDMRAAVDPVGPENDRHIVERARAAGSVVCAWGPNASGTGRPEAVVRMLRASGVRLQCLHITKDGSPGHPLMLSYDRPLIEYLATASPVAPKARPVHRAKHVTSAGDVSPLCAPKPRRLDLTRSSWTLRDDAVTCPRCRALIAARHAPEVAHG